MTWPGRSSAECSGGDTRVGYRPQHRLDLLPAVLVVGRQRELLTQGLEWLVHSEARAERRDLEQDAARLAEVDGAEVEAVDHRRRARPGLDHPLASLLVIVHLGGPGDVVDAAGSLKAALGGRRVEAVEASASIAAGIPAVVPGLEAERLEEPAARIGVARV